MNGSAPSLLTGAVATGSLAAIESATGICVPLFVWGAVGGLWAFWYLQPMSLCQRIMSLGMAALVASVLSKPLALVLVAGLSHYLPWWPQLCNAALVDVPVALIVGLLCHAVIGRKIIEVANRFSDGVFK